MHQRPNIVVLLNDHQAYYRHGWDGGPIPQRPSFDRLAAGGALMRQARAASPLCSPARRTMLTGLYPHNHGEIQNDTCHPWDRPTFLQQLAATGYDNYWFGKWHAGSGTAADHGCAGFSYPSYNNPYTKSEYRDYLERHHLSEPEVLIERSFMARGGPTPGERYRQDRDWCNEHASGILLTGHQTHESTFLAHLACEQLRRSAASSDQPFCTFVSFWGPHPPYFPSAEFAAMYQPEDIPLYPSFTDDLSDKPTVHRSEANAGISRDGRIVQPNPLPWQEWQKVIARCYAQITEVDAAGGMVLDTLDELGLSDNTLVVWTTDHGDAVASHGGHFDKRSYLSEEVLRIPFTIRWPSRIPRNQVRDELVGHLDMAPTILEAAQVTPESQMDGDSLLGMLDGTRATWRQFNVSETHGHMENVIGRALSDGEYKYSCYDNAEEELYNIKTDPYELTNLAAQSLHAEARELWRERLADWRGQTNDVPAQS